MLLQESYFYFKSHAFAVFWSTAAQFFFLPSYLREDLERLQKRAMKIIYPELSYAKALELSVRLKLYDRREKIAAKLFDEICANLSGSQSPQTRSK